MSEQVLKTDHYNFTWSLRPIDIDRQEVYLDPYTVAAVWKLGHRDPSGCLFHVLKTIARLSRKDSNSIDREIDAIIATMERFREVRKINDMALLEKEEKEALGIIDNDLE